MTIETTLIFANKRLKQRANNKRLDVSLLFRLFLRNSVFETVLGD
jgi:hypothetical protein